MALRVKAKAARLSCIICGGRDLTWAGRACAGACARVLSRQRNIVRCRAWRASRVLLRRAARERAIASTEALARADAEIAARLLWARALLSESDEGGGG